MQTIVFALVLLHGFSPRSAQAAPGATVPWTTYEAEDMTNNGTILGPRFDPNTVEAESSGRKCVQLAGTGQYVELTAQAAANALVVRYSVPDSPDGAGIDSTISLYTNGVFAQKLPLTSKYSWLYGAYPFSNSPQQAAPRNFYDEVRLPGPVINPGDKVRLQKDVDDAAACINIDLVDLENVAPALAKPAGNWLSIKDPPYNALGNGIHDDTTAFQNCINDAVSSGKNVWAPPGSYKIAGDMNNLQNVTIQGAGMWYTTFVGDPAVYNANAGKRVRFNGSGSNVHFNDFAIVGKLNYRNDGEANDGFSEIFGTNSSISRVWVEHTKTGAWIANAGGMVISDCRVRNTIADGINLSVGVQNTLVTNCTTRGTGDDCLAMWPATYRAQTYVPGGNVFSHCTAELAFLANGGALYGGISNRIEDCLFRDMAYGCGVLLSGTFPVGTNLIAGTTVVQGCDLLRCGGYDPGYQWRAAFQFTMENHAIAGVIVSNVNILDSASDGMGVIAGNTLTAAVYNLNIPYFGLGVLGRHGLWAANNTHGTMTVSNSTLAEYKNSSSTFTFTFTNDTFLTGIVPEAPTSVAATRFDLAGANSQTTLRWQGAQFATAYNVKLATNNGGPFTTIATTTTSGYVLARPTIGPACYYVVSATNASGESPNSTQVVPVPGTALTLTTGTFHDNSVLALAGNPTNEIYGVGLGNNTTAHTTANGFAFGGYPNANLTYGDGNSLAYGGFLSTATSGDAAFNAVLDNAALSQDNNGTVVLKNLTVGTAFNALFLLMDARSGVGPRAFNVTSGAIKTAYQSFAFEAGTPVVVGSYALGTFTAAATNQSFFVGANTYLQLNAVLLASVGPGLPPVLSATTNNNTLTLRWPPDHLGWRLEAQTNTPGAGLKSQWFTVPGSTATNQMLIPINTTSGPAFFRLAYP